MNGIICYIGIGSNLGNALKNCQHAIKRISRAKEIEIIKVSSFYKTEPIGIENQNLFINAVVEIKTNLSASNLFRNL